MRDIYIHNKMTQPIAPSSTQHRNHTNNRRSIMYKLYFILPLLLLIFSVGPGYANAEEDSGHVATKVICNVVVFVQKLGLPIMTGVI